MTSEHYDDTGRVARSVVRKDDGSAYNGSRVQYAYAKNGKISNLSYDTGDGSIRSTDLINRGSKRMGRRTKGLMIQNPNLVINPTKNNKIDNEQVQKQGYKDAHELKEDYVPKKDISKYDMKYDTKTGEIYLENKDGTIQIPTGLIHMP